MTDTTPRRSVALAAPLLAACCLLLSACATPPPRPALYDFGPPPAPAQQPLPALPPLALAAISSPAWLDGNRMFYRLAYDNPQQPRAYAYARWTMSPAELLEQRFKARIAAAGGVPLAASEGAFNVPVLRIEADDFTQVFDTRDTSRARVSLRASVYRGRVLVAHKAFLQEPAAATADAAGGAAALAAASDALSADMITWLGTLPLK